MDVVSLTECFATELTAGEGGNGDFAGSKNLLTAREGGNGDFAGSKNLPRLPKPLPSATGVLDGFGLGMMPTVCSALLVLL